MATDAPRVVSPLPASSSRPSSPASPRRRRFSHIFSSFNLFSRPTTPDRAPRKSGSVGTSTAQAISNDEETASSVDAGIVDSSTSFGSPRSLVLTPLSSTPTSPSPPPSSPQSPKLGRSLSASKAGGIGSKIGAVLRVRSLKRRREAAQAAETKQDTTDPRRHSHFREESDESGYIQDDEAATSVNDEHLPRPPLQRKSSSGRMQVVRGWKDEEGRESVVKEATARRAKISHGGTRKDDGVELLLPVTETEHSSQNHGATRSNSQRSRSTVGSAFTEDLFYEALDSFEDEDKTPLGSEKTARPDEGKGQDDANDGKNNGGDRISGTEHGNNKLSDINNYDGASLHPRVESALSSAPLSSDGDLEHSSTTTSSNGDNKPRFNAGLSKADPQGTITRASLAVSSDNSSSAVFHPEIDSAGVVQDSSSDTFDHSGSTAEQRRNNTRSTPEAIAQLSEYDIANIGIEVDPSTPETSVNSAEVQPLTTDPSPSPRGRTPSPSSHRRPPQRPSSTPPGSYTLDRDQDREIEKDNSTLAQVKTMISHPHSASASSSSAGQPSSFPPYPYAHLYPQQSRQQSPPPQQPQTSSSRHHHRTPHSHHGHGSGSGFAHNVPHQYQQPPQQKEAVSQSPWSGTLAAPASNSASSKAQKAWWSHFNFVRAMKKDGNAGDSGGYQAPDSAVPNGVVFGKPLKESLRYANVQISTADANGELYVWGYIPVVVAKCGLYLKENATEVPGTFRVNGSTKRMRLLQEAFETPPRYGKNLDWKQENYTTHDVASVFRRYLTQMPEPVIPYDLYHQFRDTLAKATNNQEEGVSKFKALIRQMPRANQYLLLYVLDLLSVFARKSDVNLMTATNLAVIFRPGLISHPNHEMSPQEHALSQKVLEFLIAQQDWFMLDIPPPPSRRNTTQNSPAIPAVQDHERRASADQRHAHPQPPQPLRQSSTTAVHHLSLDQQQHSQPQNVSPNVPPLSPFGPSSVAPSFAPQSRAPLAASPFQRGPSLSRFGSRSGRPLSEVGSEIDDVMIIPGGVLEEKEEFSAGPGGGWRLVSKTEQDAFKDRFVTEKDRLKMARRRTMERSDLQNREDALEDDKTRSGGPSSPVPTTHSHQSNGSGVKRSRTLPTSRRNDSDSKRQATSGQTAAGELVQASAGSTISKDKENYGSSLGSGAKDPSRRGLLLKKGRRASHAVEKDRTL